MPHIGRKLTGTNARNLQNMQRNHLRDKKDLAKTNQSSYTQTFSHKKNIARNLQRTDTKFAET